MAAPRYPKRRASRARLREKSNDISGEARTSLRLSREDALWRRESSSPIKYIQRHANQKYSEDFLEAALRQPLAEQRSRHTAGGGYGCEPPNQVPVDRHCARITGKPAQRVHR